VRPSDLPEHLAERVRPLSGARHVPAGEFVLYWMHHAVRAEENPALDTATAAALALDLPLLVYQGLGGRHRYNSDRHHTFILEGARDVATALTGMGVRHVFHLARDAEAPSPLPTLSARAALVVTEDFPAPPFPAWTRALGRRITAPVWCVDCTCVLPMQRVGRAYDRAFEFRRAHGAEQMHRAQKPWPVHTELAKSFEGDPGFEPLALDRADLAALCADCDIDHSIGPAPETRGGSAAALARWSAFLDAGLASYHRLRNDAAVEPPRGVSRLSPYLHHGHISPFRVAREALAYGSGGADKFLDELLVWRELAHNFCFHHEHRPGGLENLARLPQWARVSLQAHESDPRTAVYDRERMARGETGDALWDAAQQSLLIHGELHNNLRMTWGKALLNWARSPEQALRVMIDLNHRYALDGNDPNSYGGLLYCLGLFDRPFSPERPVFGAVRTRSSAAHAQRLDLPRYRQRIGSRGVGRPKSVAVVGAGIAGLAAARTLSDQGFVVSVFDCGRGVGGRTAHRRAGVHRFDHGAQYFTARDPRFARFVEAWIERGVVAPWDGRIVKLSSGGTTSATSPVIRYVGAPGMNALAKHLARDISVITQCSVSRMRRGEGNWTLQDSTGADLGSFDALVLAMPPEQIARIDVPTDLLAAEAVSQSQPCWCAMAAFDEPLPIDFDGAFVNHPVLDWLARDSSKPGRPAGERWVIHAAADWAATRLGESKSEIAQTLLGHFFDAVALAPREPVHLDAQRWSYARPDREVQVGCIWHNEHAVALCGDWCSGGRVEGAFLSGGGAAGRIAGATIENNR
jgi:photolyase PhrII